MWWLIKIPSCWQAILLEEALSGIGLMSTFRSTTIYTVPAFPSSHVPWVASVGVRDRGFPTSETGTATPKTQTLHVMVCMPDAYAYIFLGEGLGLPIYTI